MPVETWPGPWEVPHVLLHHQARVKGYLRPRDDCWLSCDSFMRRQNPMAVPIFFSALALSRWPAQSQYPQLRYKSCAEVRQTCSKKRRCDVLTTLATRRHGQKARSNVMTGVWHYTSTKHYHKISASHMCDCLVQALNLCLHSAYTAGVTDRQAITLQ